MHKLIKDGTHTVYNCRKFVCDIVADLDGIDVEEASCGSTALIIATKELYILNTAKQWVLFTTYSDTTGAGGGVGGGILEFDDDGEGNVFIV